MKHYLLLCLLLLLANTSQSQMTAVRHITQKEGLPSNAVYNILQDKKGYIWITTDKGLCRFDGIHYKPYTTGGMSSRAGSYLSEDKTGRIWYANFDGQIFYVENDSLQSFGNKEPISSNFVVLHNSIWLLHDSTLRSYHTQSGKLLKKLSIPHAIALFKLTNQFELIAFNRKKLSIFDSSGIPKDSLCLSRENNRNKIFRSIQFQNTDYIIFYNESEIGIECQMNKQVKKVVKFKNIAHINGAGLTGDEIWIATKSGIILYSTTSEQAVTLLDNEITSHSITDYSGNRWVSTMNGIYIFSKSGNQFASALPSPTCRLLSHQRELYLYDNNGTVFLFNKLQNSCSTLYQDKSKNSIYQIYIQNKPDSGFDFKNESLSHFSNTFTHAGKTITLFNSGIKEAVAVDHKYMAVAKTGGCELIQNPNTGTGSVWDSLARRNLITTNGISDNKNVHILVGSIRAKSVAANQTDNIIYFATNAGIKTATPGGTGELTIGSKLIYADKIITHQHKTIFLSNDGSIILRNGIQVPVQLENLNTLIPVLGIKQLKSHFLMWNHRDVYFLPFQNLNEKTSPGDFSIPDISLLGSEINDVEWIDSTIYISTETQLIACNQNKIKSRNNEPPFYINEIKTRGKRYAPEKEIILDADDNDIQIHFSVLDFLNTPFEISYKLNNDQWKEIEPFDRNLEFNALSSGNYLLKFKINGIEQKNAVSFQILVPWYLQRWFLISSVIAIMAMLTFYFKRRMFRQQIENKLLLEKTKLEKDLRQSMLSGIKSQMNPHFIFNALNTIQSYIITEDKTKASNYLSKFSKLTRKILEMSDKETITLQEEIDALLLYIELEKMRFQELNFTIEIDKDIVAGNILIPSMIIQPYVENAIKHGLMHKEGDKQLFIHLFKTENHLMIRVEDNGIGRLRSKQINRHKNESHKSFASHANMKRVEILNLEKNEIGIDFIDKTNVQNEACGTIIQIKIPLKQSK